MKLKNKFIFLFCLISILITPSAALGKSGSKEFQIDILSQDEFINIYGIGDYIYAQDDEYKLHILDQSFNDIIYDDYLFKGNYFDNNGIMLVSNYNNTEKYGYINTNGEKIIELIYDDAYPFENGVALVKKDGLWGGIDIYGNTVIDFQFDTAAKFNEGRAVVTKDGKYLLIDSSGTDISHGIYDKYTSINLSKNGYAYVTSDEQQKISFTDFDVKEIYYTNLFLYENTPTTKAEFENPIFPNYSIIDPFGNTVIDNLEPNTYTTVLQGPFTSPSYRHCFAPTRFSDYGITFAKRNGKFGIIDTAGNILYDFILDSYVEYGENYIGKIGEIQIVFDKFGNECILNLNEYDDKYYYPCVNSELMFLKKNELYGIFKLNGEAVLPAEYEIVGYNSENYILYKNLKYYVFNIFSEELYEFMLKDGFSYDVLKSSFNSGFLNFWNESNGLWGVTDYEGNIIAEPYTSSNLIYSSTDSSYVNISENGNTLYYNSNGDLLYYNRKNTGTYSSTGEKVYPTCIDIYNHMNQLSADNFYEAWIGDCNYRSIITINEIPKPQNDIEQYICLKAGTPLVNTNGNTTPIENSNYFIKPIMDNGNLLFPIDPLVTYLGLSVDWNDETKTAAVKCGVNTVFFPLNNSIIYINGKEKQLNCEIEMINNRMYIPAQELLSGLGINYIFDIENETLTIFK